MRRYPLTGGRVCVTLDKDVVLDRCVATMHQRGINPYVGPDWRAEKTIRDGVPNSRFLPNCPYAITAWMSPDNSVQSLPLAVRHLHLVDYSFRAFFDDGDPLAEGVIKDWLNEGRDAVSDTFEDLAITVAASLLIVYDRAGILLRTCG